MKLTFRNVQPNDLDKIMEIETASFSEAEAATYQAMKTRIEKIPETFIVALIDKNLAGYIVGPSFNERYLTDELYSHISKNSFGDSYQTVLSLAVDSRFRHQGIASQLLAQFALIARLQKRRAITLTCLASLIPFYKQNGYADEGLSQSQHAGEKWHNMVKELTV